MANNKSSAKRARQGVLRNEQNRKVRSRLRTEVKQARAAIESGDADTAQSTVAKVQKSIDSAVRKGLVKVNTAARSKSRLTRQANKVSAT